MMIVIQFGIWAVNKKEEMQVCAGCHWDLAGELDTNIDCREWIPGWIPGHRRWFKEWSFGACTKDFTLSEVGHLLVRKCPLCLPRKEKYIRRQVAAAVSCSGKIIPDHKRSSQTGSKLVPGTRLSNSSKLKGFFVTILWLLVRNVAPTNPFFMLMIC